MSTAQARWKGDNRDEQKTQSAKCVFFFFFFIERITVNHHFGLFVLERITFSQMWLDGTTVITKADPFSNPFFRLAGMSR